jgi:hypothetical protein
MLSAFDKYQQTLMVAYRTLCVSEPPTASELQRVPELLGAESRTQAYLRDALAEISRSSKSVGRLPSDWKRLGTGLPRQRKVRAR